MRLRGDGENRQRVALPGRPDHMRHGYSCAACGADTGFEVAKKGRE
jgi:hypothetical protein